MEVNLPQNQELQLANGELFDRQVQIGIDQMARGEFVEEEEMDARVERMLQS